MTPSRPLAAPLGAAIILGALAGCATYQADPLDLPAHRAAWQTRTAGDESVRAFAQRLETESPGAVAFDPDDGLSVREGELVALVYNPDLRVARLHAGVAAADADHAGRWDDPGLSFDVMRITESVANPWIVAGGLSVTVPISGRLAAERARADAADARPSEVR